MAENKKSKTTVEQVEENLAEEKEPGFGLPEIRRMLPRIAEFHHNLSEFEMNLEKDKLANELSLAIDKLSSSVTLLTKYCNNRRKNG